MADSDVLLWAMGVAYNSGLDVKIGEPDVGPMQIQGPRSKDVLVDLFGETRLNHHAAVVGGVLADECGKLLSDFFSSLRSSST